MSAKNRARKAAAKGYAMAGQIYRTKDMEQIIKQIRYSRSMWRMMAICGYVAVILLTIAWVVVK